MDTYIIISNSDGDTSVDPVTKDELTQRLNSLEEWYGPNCGFRENLDEYDTNCWGNNIAIIKGKLVVPKPATVVETYTVE